MAKKKKSFECPECGEEFDSERGMKIHQSRSHKKKSSSKKSGKSSASKKKDNNVIHIKYEKPEAIQSKKDLLFAQKELLEILKHIKKYHLLRKKELTLKTKARQKMKDIGKELNNLKKGFPKLKMPEILKEEEEEKKEEKKEEKVPEKIDHSNIDKELDEIQRKLAKLEQSTQISQ